MIRSDAQLLEGPIISSARNLGLVLQRIDLLKIAIVSLGNGDTFVRRATFTNCGFTRMVTTMY